MATTVRILSKNLFNKSRFKKCQAFKALLNETFTESYPNGNSGYCQTAIAAIANTFPKCVVKRTNGDPVSMGHIVFDPSKMTPDDMLLCKKLTCMVDGLPVDENHPRGGWTLAYEGADWHRWVNRVSVFEKLQKDSRNNRIPLSKLLHELK